MLIRAFYLLIYSSLKRLIRYKSLLFAAKASTICSNGCDSLYTFPTHNIVLDRCFALHFYRREISTS